MPDQSQTAETQTEAKTDASQAQTSVNDEQGKETKAEKTYTQAELDAKVEERLLRERKQAADRETKARTEAEAKALAEQGEFKKLSETQAKTLLDLTAERDGLSAERESLKAKADKYEKALNSLLDTHKAAIPEHVKPLLDRLDPVEQLQWIADNGGKVGVNGVPATPKANGQGMSEEQKRAIQQDANRFYRNKL